MTVAELYVDWAKANTHLVNRIRQLDDEALRFESAPGWPVWAIIAHVAGTRVYWLCGVFKEPGAESTPFPDATSGVGWEDDLQTPRRGDELVAAMESTWRIIESCLNRWTLAMLSETFDRPDTKPVQVHSRKSVLNRMFSHDAFHAGEISLMLGEHGRDAIDLWRSLPK
jgi:uncharacterized damage-inducible protein DinB